MQEYKTRNKRTKPECWKLQHERSKCEFRIIDKKIDLDCFDYLKSFPKWTPEERVNRFVPLIQTIGKLLRPSDLDCNLVRPGEIVVCDYKDIGAWRKEEKTGRHTNNSHAYKFYFAVEGIKKSTEFCFHLILHHMLIVMQYRMLIDRCFKSNIFSGRGGDWIQMEIKKRLGLLDYKIYEDIDENEKLIENSNFLKFKEKPKPLAESSFNYKIRKEHAKTTEVS